MEVSRMKSSVAAVQDFKAEAKIFRALSEPIRLQIISMIACNEICACNLLTSLSISQPTLSHHMKVLMECELVKGRKDATWMYYSINEELVETLHHFIDELTTASEKYAFCSTLDNRKKGK
jgi:ArsR family transcriptional regulator, arsenate/arsenite/antimonite-responsive transcriptional repressor